MSNYLYEKYDIGVTNTDGNIIGMMLVRDKDNTPVYELYDDEYLAQQYFTGSAGYENLPAEKELAIRQDSWRSGLGLEVYDQNDPERFFRGNMDTRFKGMAIAGVLANAIPRPTNSPPQIIDANMEAANALWVNETAFDASYTHGGNQALQIVASATSKEASQILTNYVKGAQYEFNCWVYVKTPVGSFTTAKLGMYDGLSTNYGGTAGSGDYDTYVLLNASKVLNIGASQLKVLLWGENPGDTAEVWFDDAGITMTPMTFGLTSCFATFNNSLYASFGRVLGKLTVAGNAFNAIAYMPANITALTPFVDSQLYIATNYGSPPGYSMNTAEQFSAMAGGVNTFQFLETVHSANPTMWGNVNGFQIRSTLTPSNAATWSGVTNVDSSWNNVTGLLNDNGALYIMKEDKPYYLTSTGAVQSDLAPELQSLKSSTSGRNAFLWKGKIYIPCGAQGLLETDGISNNFISPSLYGTNLSTYTGRVMAVTGDEEYLFIGVDNGGQVEILAGREEYVGGVTSWVWHCIAELTLTGIEAMFVSTIYQKRLYISSTVISESLYYIPLPNYGDILNDANRQFASNTFMETPFLHGNFRDTDKAFPELTLSLGHTYNTAQFFQAHYRTRANATYTLIANYVGSATSMKQTNFLPDAGANHPVDTDIRLKFVVNTDDALKTPILLSYNLKGLLYPPRRNIIACLIKCSDGLILKDGTQDTGSSAIIATTLEQLRLSKWPVSCRDIDGNTKYWRLLSSSNQSHWSIINWLKGRRHERHYKLLLQEVALS